MKINKRFGISLGLGFMALGVGVILLGFILSGFNVERYVEQPDKWYYTLHITE